MLKMTSKNDNGRIVAFADIREYIKQNKIQVSKGKDIWYVTPNFLTNQKTGLLNKKLDIHKINKFGEKMIRHKNKQNENTSTNN